MVNGELIIAEDEAIISEEMWNQARRKRQETGALQVKTHSLEHEHILSGIIKCPVCGSGMYGNVNRKKHPDGGYYKDYFYYACKHRKLVDGNRCTYKRQWNEERIKAAVGVLLITAGTVLLARFGYDTCMSGIGGWNAIDKRKK